MVSRRIFFKSMSILSGGIVLTGTPVTHLAAKSSVTSGITRKMRVVIVGSEKSAEPYLNFAVQNPESITMVATAGIDTLSQSRSFTDFEAFLTSGMQADVVLFTGPKNNKPDMLKALKAGYHVWSDRPVAFTPLACKKLNNIAAGYFCKIQIAHIIGNNICMMENKIYSARV